MKFVSVRDLRSKSSAVWKKLKAERDLILTHNGKPFAIMTATDEDMFEESLKALRQARALWAIRLMQEESRRRGTDKMTLKEINAEIKAARAEMSRERRSRNR